MAMILHKESYCFAQRDCIDHGAINVQIDTRNLHIVTITMDSLRSNKVFIFEDREDRLWLGCLPKSKSPSIKVKWTIQGLVIMALLTSAINAHFH